jgi:hypothetical protein
VLACLAAIGSTVLLSAVSCAILVHSNTNHYRARLFDSRNELDRALLRIERLEQMLDESRAHALNVAVPLKSGDVLIKADLPSEVLAELDEIEDAAARADLESDIRIQIDAHPTIDPLVIARGVLGG